MLDINGLFSEEESLIRSALVTQEWGALTVETLSKRMLGRLSYSKRERESQFIVALRTDTIITLIMQKNTSSKSQGASRNLLVIKSRCFLISADFDISKNYQVKLL